MLGLTLSLMFGRLEPGSICRDYFFFSELVWALYRVKLCEIDTLHYRNNSCHEVEEVIIFLKKNPLIPAGTSAWRIYDSFKQEVSEH